MEMNEGKMIFHAPEPWTYVGYIDGELSAGGSSTTISCTCNVEGKCSPFFGSGPLGSTSGCAGGCTDCTMKKSSIAGGGYGSGGYYSPSQVPRIMERGEELPPASFKAMFDVPEVQQGVQNFLDNIYNGEPLPELINNDGVYSLPEGYVFAIVNMYGRGSIVPVPSASLSSNSAAGLNGSCACTEGTCEFKKGAILGAGAIWCEGACTGTCTLTVSGIMNPTDLLPSFEYKLTSFEF
jgi:hypothetical protein